MEVYRILMEVIEAGSFSSAAVKLGYTPSGISRIIAGLEKRLGFHLLYRGKNGIRPTGDCEQILPVIRELLFAEDKLEQLAAHIRGAEFGRIVIGTAYSHYYQWITEVTSAFHALHPGVQFQIVNGTSTELAEKLQQYQLDFCMISKRDGISGWIPLLKDQMVVMLPNNHELAGAKAFPMERFQQEPYIETYPKQDIDNARVFERCGIRPNTQFSTMDIYATYSMVEAGLGISMNNQVNSHLWNGTVKHLPLKPEQMVEIGLAYGAQMTPVAEAFLEYTRERLPESCK